jgi:hypothetical protein
MTLLLAAGSRGYGAGCDRSAHFYAEYDGLNRRPAAGESRRRLWSI